MNLHKSFKFTAVLSVLLLSACQTIAANSFSSDSSTIKRQFVDGNFGQVHVRISGVDTGKAPLVLLHPTPYSSQFYIPFIEEMRSDRIVIAMDTPGYGDSTRPDKTPNIEDYGKNAIAVLDELGLSEPVDVIGYHTGTLIGVEMALIEPSRVNKVILAGIPVYSPDRLPDLYAKYAKPDVLEKDGSHLKSKWGFATQTMDAGISLEKAQSHFSDYMQSIPYSSQAYYGVFSYPGYEQLPRLSQPSLFVAINGSLKQETMDAQKLTPQSELIYLDDIKTGLFDIAFDQMADISRNFFDAKN